MTIESDIVDLLEDGRVRQPIAIAECLPQHKAASVIALVSAMASKSQLVKVPGKGFTLPQHAPADAVGPDWAVPNIAPFTRVLLYVRRHQPVKRSTVVRVLKNHVAEVNRVITECIGIGHVHQIGDMLREGADPRRAAKQTPSEEEVREAETSATSEVPEAAAAPTRAGDAPDESAASESPQPAMVSAGASAQPPYSIWQNPAPQSGDPLVPPGINDDELQQLARDILNDSHAIDQEPAMPDVPDDAIPLMRTGNRKARDTSQDERHAQGMADVEFDYLHNGLRIVIAGPRDRALSFINHLLLKMRF